MEVTTVQNVDIQALLGKVALTPEEVGRVLPLSRTSIYEALQKGSIPSIRVGRKFMVPGSWLRKTFA
jgi:excisionase family DNA binding protein